MSEVKICKYCGEPAGRLYLICQQCDEFVHVECCKGGKTPGGLSGDVFYIYYCRDCSENRVESFQRAKMSWFVQTRYSLLLLLPGYVTGSTLFC